MMGNEGRCISIFVVTVMLALSMIAVFSLPTVFAYADSLSVSAKLIDEYSDVATVNKDTVDAANQTDVSKTTSDSLAASSNVSSNTVDSNGISSKTASSEVKALIENTGKEVSNNVIAKGSDKKTDPTSSVESAFGITGQSVANVPIAPAASNPEANAEGEISPSFQTIPDSEKPEKFVVMSDVHVPYSANTFGEDETTGKTIYTNLNDGTQAEVYGKVLTQVKEEGFENVLVVGDLTGNSSQKQYDLYNETVAKFGEGLNVVESIGNHELASRKPDVRKTMRERWVENMGTGVYFDTWIGDVHVWALGSDEDPVDEQPTANGFMSKEQLDWLEAGLTYDYEHGVTSVVMSHWPADNTYPASTRTEEQTLGEEGSFIHPDGAGARLADIINKHPNAVMFSGHTHASIWRKGKLAVAQTAENGGLFVHDGFILASSTKVGPMWVAVEELRADGADGSEDDSKKTYELKWRELGKADAIAAYTWSWDVPAEVKKLESRGKETAQSAVQPVVRAVPLDRSLASDADKNLKASSTEAAASVDSESAAENVKAAAESSSDESSSAKNDSAPVEPVGSSEGANATEQEATGAASATEENKDGKSDDLTQSNADSAQGEVTDGGSSDGGHAGESAASSDAVDVVVETDGSTEGAESSVAPSRDEQRVVESAQESKAGVAVDSGENTGQSGYASSLPVSSDNAVKQASDSTRKGSQSVVNNATTGKAGTLQGSSASSSNRAVSNQSVNSRALAETGDGMIELIYICFGLLTLSSISLAQYFRHKKKSKNVVE